MMSIRRPTMKTIQSIVSQRSKNEALLLAPSQAVLVRDFNTITNNNNTLSSKSSSSAAALSTQFQCMTMSTRSPRGGSGGDQGRKRSNFNKNNQRKQLQQQQPPQSSKRKNFPDPNLRTHAVSIFHGDYTDYSNHDDDDDYKLNGTIYDKFSQDDANDKWDIQNFEGNNYKDEEDEDEKWQKEREAEAYQQQLKEDAQKAKWMENAKPPVRVPKIDQNGKSYGKGGRKVSTARVWIYPGEGILTVNRREFLDYFPRESDREMILSPFVATRTCGMFDVTVQVEGGGVTGKAGAIRHGIARALEKYHPDWRPPMKRLGFMTRDNRQVERKKIGKKKARKAPQWVRR